MIRLVWFLFGLLIGVFVGIKIGKFILIAQLLYAKPDSFKRMINKVVEEREDTWGEVNGCDKDSCETESAGQSDNN